MGILQKILLILLTAQFPDLGGLTPIHTLISRLFSNPSSTLSAVTSGPQTCHCYYGLTWTIPAAGWWTVEPQLQGEGQL